MSTLIKYRFIRGNRRLKPPELARQDAEATADAIWGPHLRRRLICRNDSAQPDRNKRRGD
jgi:hypothetical protein